MSEPRTFSDEEMALAGEPPDDVAPDPPSSSTELVGALAMAFDVHLATGRRFHRCDRRCAVALGDHVWRLLGNYVHTRLDSSDQWEPTYLGVSLSEWVGGLRKAERRAAVERIRAKFVLRDDVHREIDALLDEVAG